MSYREIVEGVQYQGADESVVYTLTTTNWGSSPSNVSVSVFSLGTDGSYTDVTATVMPTNTPSVSGDVITFSPLTSLTAGTKYRMEIQFDSGSSTFEAFVWVQGER